MQPGQSNMSLSSGQAVNDLLNWLLFYDLGSISQQHDSDHNYANILNQLTEEFQSECVSVFNFYWGGGGGCGGEAHTSFNYSINK